MARIRRWLIISTPDELGSQKTPIKQAHSLLNNLIILEFKFVMQSTTVHFQDQVHTTTGNTLRIILFTARL